MRSLSLLLGIVITAFGVFLIYLTSTSPSSAFNEITATLVILTGAVFLVGFGIISSLSFMQTPLSIISLLIFLFFVFKNSNIDKDDHEG